jgi:methanogenic corrinoid protein MtbC1
MSINSISSNQMNVMQMSSSGRSSGMSTEQSSFVSDLLSQYDANSLSKDDAQEIVKSLQEAGIEPSKSLETAMASAGFDAKEIGDLAEVGQGGGSQGQRPMGPPPPKTQEMSSVSDLLQSLLDSESEDETTTNSTSSFDTVLDYTTKIVSLKDDAKTEVMDILNTYNSEENTLSKEDTQKVVMNSLSQILKDSDNYNRISFYA